MNFGGRELFTISKGLSDEHSSVQRRHVPVLVVLECAM